jgi:hypothetical protein
MVETGATSPRSSTRPVTRSTVVDQSGDQPKVLDQSGDQPQVLDQTGDQL